MNFSFHRRVQQDVSEALRYYDAAAGSALGDAFFAELIALIESASRNPTKFHSVKGELRRANLRRFPYHFLFRCKDDVVRILVVRHNRRHPGFGTERS